MQDGLSWGAGEKWAEGRVLPAGVGKEGLCREAFDLLGNFAQG